MTDAPLSTVSLASLGWTMLRLGAVAFGGLGTALALFQRELVEQRGWLTQRDLSEALAFTKPLPGSTVVQVVAFAGWRLRGWRGALIATATFVLPAGVLMLVGAAAVSSLPESAPLRGARIGLQLAVIGLLGNALWRLVEDEIRSGSLRAVALAAFVTGLWINAALVVIGAGLLGATILWSSADGA